MEEVFTLKKACGGYKRRARETMAAFSHENGLSDFGEAAFKEICW